MHASHRISALHLVNCATHLDSRSLPFWHPLPLKDSDRLVLLGDHLGGRPSMSVRGARNCKGHRRY